MTSPVEISEETMTSTSPVAVATTKCVKCNKKQASKECTTACCLQCCEDTNCEKHKRSREQQLLKEQILAGTSDVQCMAQEKRSKLLRPGRFREPGFVYQGDTIVIWNIRDYLSNPKWREDAVRKSNRRKARLVDQISDEYVEKKLKRLKNSRRRFHHLIEQCYQRKLQEGG